MRGVSIIKSLLRMSKSFPLTEMSELTCDSHQIRRTLLHNSRPPHPLSLDFTIHTPSPINHTRMAETACSHLLPNNKHWCTLGDLPSHSPRRSLLLTKSRLRSLHQKRWSTRLHSHHRALSRSRSRLFRARSRCRSFTRSLAFASCCRRDLHHSR